jgi:hypothetical protein
LTVPEFSNQDLLQQRRQLREMAQGFRQAQILLTCLDLGVFEALDGRRATASEVATAVGADARGVGLLLNAASALELLEKREGRFANTALAETCLTPGRPGTMAASLRLQRAFYRRWGRLADAVRSGQRPEEELADERLSERSAGFFRGSGQPMG